MEFPQRCRVGFVFHYNRDIELLGPNQSQAAHHPSEGWAHFFNTP
jgi:hypothetical protein